MANETQQTQTDILPPSIGERLKAVREELGQTRKDIAAQLRLSEAVIAMMEENKFPSDLPATFIRGYIRAYGKLINIPEAEVQAAIEPIKPVAQPVDPVPSSKPSAPVTSSNYFMQFSTYIIVLTITGLAGIWWYNHGSAAPVIADSTQITADSKPIMLPNVTDTVTDTQLLNTASNPPEAQGQLQAPSQPLAPAIGTAIAQTNTPAAQEPVVSEKPIEQPVVEHKKAQVAKKPAYLQHQDDEEDDA